LNLKALIIKKNGTVSMQEILTLRGKKSVLLNEFTFREEVMQRIYQKEKSREINPPVVERN
jgi:hypothetical protein